MSGSEQQLLSRARMLGETDDLAETLSQILAGAAAAGADPGAVESLQAAIRVLDPDADTSYHADGPGERLVPGGYSSDAEFIEALHDAEAAARDRLHEVEKLQEDIIVALDAAQMALHAARAMPVKETCDGCHERKQATIADAERRIRLCDAATGIADPLASRLRQALGYLLQVPAQLGEVYELVYAFVSRGGKMPVWGRFIKGQ